MHDRQRNSTGSPRAPTSPTMSPMNRHGQAGSAAAFNMRRGPNTATKAAAQRLAQVMSHSTDEDEEDDDLALDYAAISGGGGIGLGGTGRATPARASMVITFMPLQLITRLLQIAYYIPFECEETT